MNFTQEESHTMFFKKSIEDVKRMIDTAKKCNKPNDKKEVLYWFTPRAYYTLENCKVCFLGDSLTKIVGIPTEAMNYYLKEFKTNLPEYNIDMKLTKCYNRDEHDYIVIIKWND